MSLRSLLVVAMAALVRFSPLNAEERIIVAFRQNPLSVSPAAQGHYETLRRFREDLGQIPAVAAKTAPPSITREYVTAFHGAAVRIPNRETLLAISGLSYVAAIFPDREVEAYGAVGSREPAIAALLPNAGGQGVLVAIIDSGIDYRHPALGAGFGPGFKVRGGYDFVNDDGDPMDDHRHGTHVAGIVAASGAGLSGIAPEASLLAYKVLNAEGKGQQSDVIAAIERSLDPNGDGDLSDRAHIINLSLGAPGSPDDPVSQAVDNASLTGTVVCAAVGNDGLFHNVPSPAAARSAIAVGAIDADGVLADFSNRGPAAVDGAIKPDVVAPGVSILSTVPGGGTALLSGTSMASPYVAGLAALLREANPSWAPSRIKAAIVNHATPINGVEVMSQGSGRVDRDRSIASRASADPAQLNFGLYSRAQGTWTATRTLSITNSSSEPASFRARADSSFAAITLAAFPPEVSLQPGETRSMDVTITVDNTKLGEVPSPSFSFGGVIHLESGTGSLTVPWSFIKAARASVSWDLEFPQVLWTAPELRRKSFALTGPRTVETLLEPGQYDLAIVSEVDGELHLVITESIAIDGDVKIEKRSTEAVHTIALDARDGSGQPLPQVSTDDAHYFPQSRLLLPPGSGVGSIELPRMGSKTMRTSSFSDRFGLLFSETFIDGTARQAFVAQHEPIRGLGSDRVLQKMPGDYRAQDIVVRFPADSTKRELGMLGRGMVRNPEEIGRAPEGVLQTVGGDTWNGTIFMTPETHPDFASGVQFFAYTGHSAMQGLASMITPMTRLVSGGFVSALQFAPPPLPVESTAGEPFGYPSGPIYPLHILTASTNGLSGSFEWQGQRNERRNLERASSMIRVTNGAGQEVVRSNVQFGNIHAPLPGPGAYRAKISTDRYQLSGVLGRSEVSLGFDTRRDDATSPTITSLALLDSEGRHTTTFPLHRSGTLHFSVGDYTETISGTVYRGITAQSTRLFFRRTGAIAWTELHLDHVAEDTISSGRLPLGQIYRADLSDALLREAAIELRFEIVDGAGNDAVFEIAPAFLVENQGSRRRPARR